MRPTGGNMPMMRVSLAVVLVLSLAACKDKSQPKKQTAAVPDAGPALATREIVAVDKQGWGLKMRTQVPAAWVQRIEGFYMAETGASDLMFGFKVQCDGQPCDATTLPGQIDPLLASAVRQAKKLNVEVEGWDGGLPEVTILDQGAIPGGRFVAYKVVPPPGLPGAPVEGFRAICAKYRDGDEHFAYATVKTPLSEEQGLWPVLLQSCKSFEIIGKVAGL